MESHIKELVFCEFCKNLFDEPVVLPCSNSICKKHLSDLLNADKKTIHCYFCENEHELSSDGFPLNKTIILLIERNFEKLNFGEKYKEAWESCNTVEKALNELVLVESDPKNFIKEYFQRLKTKVDLRREEVKSYVDKVSHRVINQIMGHEYDCMANLNSNSTVCKDSKIYSFKKELDNWKSELKKFVYEEQKWKEISDSALKVKKEIDSQKERTSLYY